MIDLDKVIVFTVFDNAVVNVRHMGVPRARRDISFGQMVPEMGTWSATSKSRIFMSNDNRLTVIWSWAHFKESYHAV